MPSAILHSHRLLELHEDLERTCVVAEFLATVVSEHQAISCTQTNSKQRPRTGLTLGAHLCFLERALHGEEANRSFEIQGVVTPSGPAEAHGENANRGLKNRVRRKFEVAMVLSWRIKNIRILSQSQTE